MYAIKKGAKYVRDMKKGGGKSSYTYNPKLALTFTTFEDARKNACGNETIVKMQYILA